MSNGMKPERQAMLNVALGEIASCNETYHSHRYKYEDDYDENAEGNKMVCGNCDCVGCNDESSQHVTGVVTAFVHALPDDIELTHLSVDADNGGHYSICFELADIQFHVCYSGWVMDALNIDTSDDDDWVITINQDDAAFMAKACAGYAKDALWQRDVKKRFEAKERNER